MQKKRPVGAWTFGIAAVIGIALFAQIAVKPDSRLYTVAESVASQTTAAVTENSISYTTAVPDRNLNTADAAALKRVSGVGDVLAEAIIAYRAEIGGFTRRQQLLEIDGIGETLAARIMAEFEIPGELPPVTTAAVSEMQTALTVTTVSSETVVMRYELNRVTREELCSIPGMTETWADEILAARAEFGQFCTVYELAAVLSMPESYIRYVLFEYLYVDGETVLGNAPEEELHDIRDAAAG